MDGYELRRARPADFQEIARLDREVWDAPRVADGDHVWRHWVEDALVYGLFQEPAVRAVVLAFPGISGRYCLHKMFVDPDHRGRGLGGRLMAAMVAELDRLKAPAYLSVNPSNEAARRLYGRFGFQERERFDDYYGPGEDRLILERP